MTVFSFHTFCSLISVSMKPNIEMLTPLYSYNWLKFNNKMIEKRSQEYGPPEYVTRQINSRILELFLRQFCRLIFAPSQKS